jgi:hypothetical protein
MRKHINPSLVISILALILASSPLAQAARNAVGHAIHHIFYTPKVDGHRLSTKPYAGGILLLGKNKKFPAKAIPAVSEADTLSGKTAAELEPACPRSTVDLGTWCLEKNLYPVSKEDAGKNDYFWASQKCAELGGFLPSASELVGAVKQVELAGGPATPGQREMSSTLITTEAGSDAAGSEGVSEGSTGDKNTGEPNPIPLPADPEPETTQYVTVFADGGHGGLAGGEPIKAVQNFRCAYVKTIAAASASSSSEEE